MDHKYAVRAVVIDENNNTAILSVGGGRYFKIPGGTIEDGEDEDQALVREVLEEAGCAIIPGQEIGAHQFYVKEKDRTYHSVCYLAKLNGEKGEPAFDDWESEREFDLIWLNIDKAIEKFETCKPEEEYEAIICKRDLDFLKKAKALLK